MSSTIRALLIPADVTAPAAFIEVEDTYAALAAAIGAKWIEIVRTPIAGCVMVLDEEGLLRRRPTNRRAFVLYPGRIVGDVLLVGAAGPELVSISDEQMQTVTQAVAA